MHNHVNLFGNTLNIISTITEISRKLNQNILKKQKYQLIAEIKKSYNIEEFFNIQVSDYKVKWSFSPLKLFQINANQ